ncbi:formyltransferase family protein [Halolamina sediminis]|uniref:formyltransferase family protein n=1 Tax=Halolamina sediminis TaxID=1480675 RepID=UPI0009AE1B41|nr:formyltransferase family protein [Halolamina sediminis]
MDICLLVDAESSGWFHSSIERLINQEDDVSVRLIVRKKCVDDDTPREQPYESLIRKYVYHTFKKKVFSNSAEKSPVTPDQFDNKPELVEVEPKKVGKYRLEIPCDVLDKINSECDIIIQNHFGILTGDILDATEQGVLSVHWGNIRKYRGSYPGLWQILHDEKEITLTVQRLTEKLDGGELVYERRVDISDLITPREVKEAAYEESKHLYPKAISRIRDPSISPQTIPESELGENYRTSRVDIKIKIALVWKMVARYLRARVVG